MNTYSAKRPGLCWPDSLAPAAAVPERGTCFLGNMRSLTCRQTEMRKNVKCYKVLTLQAADKIFGALGLILKL